MEWWFWVLLYFVISTATSGLVARLEYKGYIEENVDAIPKYLRNGSRYADAELEKREVERRDKLAARAKRTGFITGILWPLFFTVITIWGICQIFSKGLNKIAIEPVDKPYVTEKAYEKAQLIIKDYEKQQKENFEKEIA